MNSKLLISLLVFFLFGTLPSHAEEIQLLQLKHRTAEELLPLIQPMNHRVKLTANGYQLIARGSPTDIAELESLIAQLDQALRQFLIRVRFSDDQASTAASQNGNVRIETGRDRQVAIGANINHHSTQRQGQDGYVARATEGMPTLISMGSQRPGYVYQAYDPARGGGVILQSNPVQTSSGFYARVRANGNLVTIEVAPQKSSFDEERGNQINVQQMQTEITGRLGEWIELGGVNQSSEYQGSGTLHSTHRDNHSNNNIYIQVEEVQP